MRIGLITPGFSASEDDWCIPAHLDLVRALARQDEVVVFALRYPHQRDVYEVHGARVQSFGGADRRGLTRLPLLLRALSGILAEARRQRFDVLHALWAHEPGFLAALAGRLARTPVAVSILGDELVDLPDISYGGQRTRANRWLVARALAGTDRVLVPSEMLERVAESTPTAGKLIRLPLAVDRERFRPGPPAAEAGRLGGNPALLQVASLVPVKDQTTLLAAFRAVARRLPEARLHLVGDDELHRRLQDQSRKLEIEDRVDWHGAVSHDLLPDFYGQADLCVVSSRFEGHPMVALEAAACGCPMAGTRVGMLSELAPEHLAEAQQAAVTELDLETTCSRLRRLYGELASERSARSPS